MKILVKDLNRNHLGMLLEHGSADFTIGVIRHFDKISEVGAVTGSPVTFFKPDTTEVTLVPGTRKVNAEDALLNHFAQNSHMGVVVKVEWERHDDGITVLITNSYFEVFTYFLSEPAFKEIVQL